MTSGPSEFWDQNRLREAAEQLYDNQRATISKASGGFVAPLWSELGASTQDQWVEEVKSFLNTDAYRSAVHAAWQRGVEAERSLASVPDVDELEAIIRESDDPQTVAWNIAGYVGAIQGLRSANREWFAYDLELDVYKGFKTERDAVEYVHTRNTYSAKRPRFVVRYRWVGVGPFQAVGKGK